MAASKAASAAATAAKAVAAGAAEAYQYPWREKLAKYKGELSKGVWGYWELGAWKASSLSARKRARLRKEVLLAGQYWEYDPPRGQMRTKRKGHKCDRVSAEKRAHTAELMKKMPDMLLDYKTICRRVPSCRLTKAPCITEAEVTQWGMSTRISRLCC